MKVFYWSGSWRSRTALKKKNLFNNVNQNWVLLFWLWIRLYKWWCHMRRVVNIVLTITTLISIIWVGPTRKLFVPPPPPFFLKIWLSQRTATIIVIKKKESEFEQTSPHIKLCSDTFHNAASIALINCVRPQSIDLRPGMNFYGINLLLFMPRVSQIRHTAQLRALLASDCRMGGNNGLPLWNVYSTSKRGVLIRQSDVIQKPFHI